MGRFISKERKEVALQMSRRGLSDRRIREYTGISERSMIRMRKTFRETGEVVRKAYSTGRPRILDSLDVTFLEACIERQPDLYLSELQTQLREICDVDVSGQTIMRTLRRRGFTRKKVTRPALERNDDDRGEYKLLIGGHFRPEQLVFTDESHFNRNTSRREYAWSVCGTRARRRDFFIRGKRYSILPAISLDGVLHLDVLDCAFNGESFTNFIRGLLEQMNPWPLSNSVIVMDNASIHHVPGIREMIEARGMRVVYLPAYSPDLNPIEEAFSAVKAWLRRHRDYVRGEMAGPAADCDPYPLIWEACYGVITPEKVYGWYYHSGYV